MTRPFSLPKILTILFMLCVGTFAFGSTVTVNYSTSGTFASGGTCSTNSCTVGKETLTYTPLASASVGVSTFGAGNGSNAQLGTFTITHTGSGSLSVFSGDTFDLTITQSAPPATPNSGTTVGTLHGQITVSGSTLKITFSPTSLSFGTPVDYVYSIFSPLSINAQTTGPTTIQGEIDVINAPGVPEPSSMLLFGSGLAGFAGILRRRTKKS